LGTCYPAVKLAPLFTASAPYQKRRQKAINFPIKRRFFSTRYRRNPSWAVWSGCSAKRFSFLYRSNPTSDSPISTIHWHLLVRSSPWLLTIRRVMRLWRFITTTVVVFGCADRSAARRLLNEPHRRNLGQWLTIQRRRGTSSRVDYPTHRNAVRLRSLQ
jgi:hypothetical protein